jgi:hypothetical protein
MNDTQLAKHVGDKINYDYIFRRQEVKVNPGLKLSTGQFDVFVSGLFGYSTSNREGLFKIIFIKTIHLEKVKTIIIGIMV